MASRPLAVVTGASTGIGYELAKCCAKDGYDLIVCADEAAIEDAAGKFRQLGTEVESVQADLERRTASTASGTSSANDRSTRCWPMPAAGLGHAFLDQDFEEAKDVVDVNITGTISLVQKVGRRMRDRNEGKILITGSIAGFIPVRSRPSTTAARRFSTASRKRFATTEGHRRHGDVPDARADGHRIFPPRPHGRYPVGKDDGKDDAAMVAQTGYDAMKKGSAHVASGFMSKVQSTFAGIIPDAVLSQMHRRMAEPEHGS